MNFSNGKILDKTDLIFESNNSEFQFYLTDLLKDYLINSTGKEITIGIRPEDILVQKNSEKLIELERELDVIEPMGNESFIYFEVEKVQFIARVKSLHNLKVGKKIELYIDPEKVYLFDLTFGKNLLCNFTS